MPGQGFQSRDDKSRAYLLAQTVSATAYYFFFNRHNFLLVR